MPPDYGIMYGCIGDCDRCQLPECPYDLLWDEEDEESDDEEEDCSDFPDECDGQDLECKKKECPWYASTEPPL